MSELLLTDVTLRDGLQMEKKSISLDQKLLLLEVLDSLNFHRLEATSFVSPKWVPQFADAEQFAEKAIKKAKTPLMAFVPNEKGLERALKFNLPWVSAFISVSEKFNLKNVNSSRDQSFAGLKATVIAAKKNSRKIRVYISTVFGCPYEGTIEISNFEKVFKDVASLNPDEIALGDTIGVAVPNQVAQVFEVVERSGFDLSKIALHLHNTYGLALACFETAWEIGVRQFDGTVAGIGGCPYAKGAAGNLALEEIYYLYSRTRGHKIEGDKWFEAYSLLSAQLGLEPTGRMFEIWKKGGSWFGI